VSRLTRLLKLHTQNTENYTEAKHNLAQKWAVLAIVVQQDGTQCDPKVSQMKTVHMLRSLKYSLDLKVCDIISYSLRVQQSIRLRH
jgi:hypothetical protein